MGKEVIVRFSHKREGAVFACFYRDGVLANHKFLACSGLFRSCFDSLERHALGKANPESAGTGFLKQKAFGYRSIGEDLRSDKAPVEFTTIDGVATGFTVLSV